MLPPRRGTRDVYEPGEDVVLLPRTREPQREVPVHALTDLFLTAVVLGGPLLVLASTLENKDIVKIALTLAISIQISIQLKHCLSKRGYAQVQLTMNQLALIAFVVAWQIVLENPDLSYIMYFPLGIYFIALINELEYSYLQTRGLINNPDFSDAPEPLPENENSPFFYPHTSEGWHFYGIQGVQAAGGFAFAGAAIGLQEEGIVSTFPLICAVLIVSDACFALIGKVAEDAQDKINAEVKAAKQAGTFGVKVPLLNQISLVVHANLWGLQKIGSFVAGFAVSNMTPLLAVSGGIQGLIRQTTQRRLERSELVVLPREYWSYKKIADVIGRSAAVSFGLVTPWYTLYRPQSRDFFTIESGMVITGCLYFSYWLSTLVEYKWRGKIKDEVAINKRGKLLSSLRYLTAEYSDPIAYMAAITLHIARLGQGSIPFQDTMWIAGYGALSSTMGLSIARINDIYTTDYPAPKMDPAANILYFRFLALLIMGSFGIKKE